MLNLQHISKYFPGVKALQDISINFAKGKVHAICGENGAGKTTLMNIIAGNLQPDEGEIIWKTQSCQILNIRQAQQMGINIVYQELSLVDSLTVAENIYPNHQPVNKWGFIDYHVLFQKTRQLLDELKMVDISPRTLVVNLSAGEKQMVEIAKALSRPSSLLILDEPTASLTTAETGTLFTIIRRLQKEGVAIVYISHRMDEIKEIADEVSILKDGRYQGTVNAVTTSTQQMIQMMVGRVPQDIEYETYVTAETKLEVKDLTGNGFRNISFSINKGEILGLAGLLGSGRTQIARAIFGDAEIESGSIIKDGKLIHPTHPSAAMKAGIAYVPDDRKALGLFLEKTVAENIEVSQLKKGWYKKERIKKVSESFIKSLEIKTPSVMEQVRKLSGGNQQKIVLAKWLALEPDLLLVNEPTHGVDIGAKAEIYKLLKSLAAEGKSILIISSELPELLLLSDRIAVIYQGSLRSILSRQEATEEKIIALASGI